MRMVFAALLLGLSSGPAFTQAIEPRQAAAAVDFSGAETVEIKLSSFAFTPSRIQLQAGRPYALKLVDTASGGHDFSAPRFFKAAQIAPEDAARVVKGKVSLKGGETALIRVVPAAGEFPLTCTHFGHSALGMTGRIIVTGTS